MSNTDHRPEAGNGLQGTSRIYKFGTSPNTRSVVTQKVRVLAPGYGGAGRLQIGVLSNFGPTESRTIENVRGIGFGDIIAELVPGNTEPMTASIERTMLYLSTLWQSTGYASGVSGPVRSLRHHRWPFDIEQQIVFSTIADREISGDGKTSTTGFGAVGSLPYEGALGGGGPLGNGSDQGSHNILITMYEGCWWGDWNTAFQKDSAMVMESGTVTITDVHDYSSVIYGEFLATGNDPSRGEVASNIYGETFTG
tara:strand:+ start:466 stop:1224 length:759 start_codon:yes stop_codon:yes gene_type:complete